MTSLRLVFWSVTSALAGFLFGFDTVVISGAEQTIQALWGLSAGMHGIAMGAALYGTVLGSLHRRLADRPVRPQADAALDRRALRRLRGRSAALRGTSSRSSSRGSSAASASASRPSPRRSTSRRSRPPASRTARRHVPVQHRLRHRRRLRSRTACSPASAKTRGAGCSASRRSRRCSTRLMCLGIPESPRWLLTRKGDRERGPRRCCG